jgi:hypothetical protein
VSRAALEEQGEIVRRVDVEADTGKVEDDRLKSGRPRRSEVVLEGWLPELERQTVGRLEENGVGAEAGKRRDERPPRGPREERQREQSPRPE